MHDDARAMLSDLPVFRFLPPEARKLVIDSCVPVSYSFGQSLLREGEEADAFFVLVSGQARVIKKGENGREISLNVLRAGDSFGETALLEKGTRTATVRASGDVDAFRLDASIFHAILQSSPESRRSLELQSRQRALHEFFRSYQPFAQLAPAAMELMLRELEPLSIPAGGMVIRQGDPPGAMYVVEEGRLRVFMEEAGSRRYVGYVRKGDIFGEVSLFKGERRTASVEAVSPCRLLRLTEETYAKLLTHPAFKRRIEERISQYDYRTIARVPLDFDQEVLPAEATVHEKVGPGQVDHDERTSADEAAAGPFASADGYFIKRTKKIRRVPFVRQIDETDCGAASLAIVCRHFGRAVSLARIRQLVHTSLDGVSLRGLCSAARELGLAARSAKVSIRDLESLPLPAIVHWEGNHWVVLYDVRKEQVAREAILCLREDHQALGDIAARARTTAREILLCLEDVETSWRPTLLAASPGEVLGPLRMGERVAVLAVRDKLIPTPRDPEIQQRAQRAAFDRAVERAGQAHVTWQTSLRDRAEG